LPEAAGVLAVTTIQLVPLLVEYSIFTLLTFTLTQVMLWLEFTLHDSLPLGDVTLTVGAD
jgi:hypothetical protein